MKYPQRGQSILQCRDSSRLEQTGQNWLGNSGPECECAGWKDADLEWTGLGKSSLKVVIPSCVMFRDEGAQALVSAGERGLIGKEDDAHVLGSRRLAEARAMN